MRSNPARRPKIPHRGRGALFALLVSCAISTASGASTPAGDALRAVLPPAPLPDIDAYMQIGALGSAFCNEDVSSFFYNSSASGLNQFYRLDRCGFPVQMTVEPNGIVGSTANTDCSFAVVSSSADGSENYRLSLVDLTSGETRVLTPEPGVRHSTPVFTRDGLTLYYVANGVDRASFAIYSMDLKTGAPTLVLDRKGENAIEDVAADAKSLLFTCSNTPTDNDVYLLDLTTKEERKLTAHEGTVWFYAPRFSNDGRSMFFGVNDGPSGATHVERMDLASLRREAIGDPRSPWELETFALSASQRYLAWSSNEEGYDRVHLMDLERGRELPLDLGIDGMITSAQPTDAGVLCLQINSPVRAADIWTYDFSERGPADGGPRLRQITTASYAGVDRATFREPLFVHYASKDGTQIPAFVYLPATYKPGSPVPFVVDVHGGPEQQARPDFNRHFQYLLAHGFGVFAPNVRGSSGYGRDFREADNYRNRGAAIQDLASGAEWLIAQGYAKPGAIGIKGVSYGGFATLAALTEYPDLFAAGIDQSGIANFITFLETTAGYRRAQREAEYGPLSDRAFLESISPIHKIDRLKAALLVVHGEKDQRVTIGEARQVIRAVEAHGTPIDSLIFPDEGHGMAKRENRLVFYRKMVAFFEEHLGK